MPSGWASLGAALAFLVLAAPLVAGAASAGDFITQGPATFGGLSSAEYQASSFFLADTSNVSFLAINATEAHFCHHELTAKELELASVSSNPLFSTPTDHHDGCFDTPSATVRLMPGNEGGWAGGRFGSPAPLGFLGDPAALVAPSAYNVMASRDAQAAATAGQDVPEDHWFYEPTFGAHLNATEAGTLRYHGHVQLKLMGPDVILQTPVNRTTWETDDSPDSGPVHDRLWKWVTMDFDGDLVLSSPGAAFQVQATAARLAWDGPARFVADSGSLSLDGTTHQAQPGEATTVDGRFSSEVSAQSGDALKLTLSGDARDATMGGARIAAGPEGTRFPWLTVAGAAVAVVMAGGATVAALRRHARPRRVKRAEALAREAAKLKEAGEPEAALLCYLAAIRLAPSGDLFFEAGLLLRRFGKMRRALRAFSRAAQTRAGGEAEHWAALCALSLGDPGRAVGWLLRALARDDLAPAVLSSLDTDAAFAALRQLGPVQAALVAARERQAGKGWPDLR